MTKFFVFSFAVRSIREGTRLVGWRDRYSFDTEKEARNRRSALRKERDPQVKRRVIRSEEWA